jgi:hypothetical protein
MSHLTNDGIMHQPHHKLLLSGRKGMIPGEVLIGVCLYMPEETGHGISKHIIVAITHWLILYSTLEGKPEQIHAIQ